jgi:hypothetical protein
MRENCTSGSMRRGEKRVMVHSANGHRTRKGGNGGAPPDLYTTALASHSTVHRGPSTTQIYTHVLNRGPAGVGSPADRLFPPGWDVEARQ